MKVASEMSARHSLDTHRKRSTEFTGSLERMSTMRSFGKDTAASVAAGAGVLVVVTARGFRKQRRRRHRSGDCCGAMAVQENDRID